jgi:hypothetical protein
MRTMSGAVTIEKVAYAGWPNCYRMSNGEIELIVTTDVGPRVIRCGFVGGQNLFVEIASQLGGSGESKWLMRGGHRLWVAPEIVPETYALDNAPVKATVNDHSIRLVQPVEPETSLQKELLVTLADDGEVTVNHRLENTGAKARQVAPWVLSQMAPGGLGFTTFPPRAGHDKRLQPTNPLVMWAYTYFTDERYKFLNRYLLMKQDPSNPYPQKVGLFNEHTVLGYLLGTDLFLKRTHADPKAVYPDFGTSAQLFVNGEFFELETLGPLVDLRPGRSIDHVERWSLHRGVKFESLTDEELDRVLLPLLGGGSV